MSDWTNQIQLNLTEIQQRIAEAASRSGRAAEAITLIAVTKYVEPDVAAAIVEAGCQDLGESRPQELWRKAEALPDNNVRWHMIGHLQRNKVRRSLPLLSLVHSIDSLRLLEVVNQSSESLGIQTRALLEVNISGESEKHGFQPAEVPEIVEQLSDFPAVSIRGLMGMSSRNSSPDVARQQFGHLRELRERCEQGAPGTLPELSMGMSGDFELAIEEGSTMVRVGSALVQGCRSA